MRKIALSSVVLGLLFALAAPMTAAQAQATRTWVSGVGDDANPCSRTAPCKTFAGAISKTAVNGEINCLDPAGYGSVTITKSMTIECGYTHGSILNSGTNGINIPLDNFTDARKQVRLRGLRLNGADTGLIGIRITGGTNSANSEVFIEDCTIDGNFGGAGRGISDERTGGGKLFVTDTTIRNMAGSGVAIIPNGTRRDVVIDRVRVLNSLFGIASGNGAKTTISNSVLSGNTNAGVEADPGAEVNVENSAMSSNGIGVQSAGGTIRISNSHISFNANAIQGTVLSHGNNRIQGNTALGGTLSPIGGASSSTGEQ